MTSRIWGHRDSILESSTQKNEFQMLILILTAILLVATPALADKYEPETIQGQSIQSGLGIAEPSQTSPDSREPEPYIPDNGLEKIPADTVSVQFLVEHRSALNEKEVTVRGVIVSTLLGEKACPPDKGMCAQPRFTIADNADSGRDKNYDLVILLSEEKVFAYEIGKIVEVSGTVTGNSHTVMMRIR